MDRESEALSGHGPLGPGNVLTQVPMWADGE